MTKEEIISKVRKLLNLANSPNTNEAATARGLADKLIEKYKLLPEEYAAPDETPIYTDDDLLFETNCFIEWKARLALAVAKKYNCFIIQEQNTVNTGEIFYKYFIYGDQVDITYTKHVFNILTTEAEIKINQNCKDKEELYVSSFCEGMVNGIRINLEYENVKLEGLTPVKEEKIELSGNSSLAKSEQPKKEAPIKERTKINENQKDIDPMAYFKGEEEGSKIHLDKSYEDELLLFTDNFPEDLIKYLNIK